METTCSKCQLVKVRIHLGNYKYVNENNRRWRRKVCPDCSQAYFRSRSPNRLITKACTACTTTFETLLPGKLTCSPTCSSRERNSKRREIRKLKKD